MLQNDDLNKLPKTVFLNLKCEVIESNKTCALFENTFIVTEKNQVDILKAVNFINNINYDH